MSYNEKHAEKANSWSHGLSLTIFLLMAIFLLRRGFEHDSLVLDLGLLLFVISEGLMYFSSTIYHLVKNPKVKRVLRYLDHSCIHLTIAGSYSPILLWAIGGTLGNVCFIVMWILAISGITYEVFFLGKYPKISLAIYIAMGWMVVFIVKPVWDAFPSISLWFLLAEGLAFTLGTYFFWKDEKHTYNHAIWHLFVFAGGVFHYLVLWFLL